ncbi:hypothetical protein JCM30566_05270 [Marinitoga arctica]
MNINKFSILIILIISFTIFLVLSQIIFNYIFQKEPYLYYGSFPIENKNLKLAKEFPIRAKAVLVLEGDILKVYLPRNSNYFDLVLKDIKIFLYDVSIKLNKIVRPYFIERQNLKAPDIYSFYIKLVGLIFFSVVFISGRLYTVFDSRNFKLFLLHYYKHILKNFILFSFIIGSFFIISVLLFKNSRVIYPYIILALSAILAASPFRSFFINFLWYMFFFIIGLFYIDVKFISIGLIFLILLNFIFNYIEIFSDKTIKVKEEKKIDRYKR